MGTASPLFEIEIVQQGWLPGDGQSDLCTHGQLRLRVGGQDITTGAADETYGISQSALALLRTVERGHSRVRPVAERLVFHGCGLILMMGCPIGIDWSVEHSGGGVRLSDIVRYDSVSEAEAVLFPNLAVELPERAYRLQIAEFARRAKEPFVSAQKAFSDDYDRQQYKEFWAEYDALLVRAAQ